MATVLNTYLAQISTEPISYRRKNSGILYVKACDFTFETGDKIYFTVKTAPDNDSSDTSAIISKDWTNGTDASVDSDGYLELNLTESDTDKDYGQYIYDIKFVRTGTATVARTLIFGEFNLLYVTTLRS